MPPWSASKNLFLRSKWALWVQTKYESFHFRIIINSPMAFFGHFFIFLSDLIKLNGDVFSSYIHTCVGTYTLKLLEKVSIILSWCEQLTSSPQVICSGLFSESSIIESQHCNANAAWYLKTQIGLLEFFMSVFRSIIETSRTEALVNYGILKALVIWLFKMRAS